MSSSCECRLFKNNATWLPLAADCLALRVMLFPYKYCQLLLKTTINIMYFFYNCRFLNERGGELETESVDDPDHRNQQDIHNNINKAAPSVYLTQARVGC